MIKAIFMDHMGTIVSDQSKYVLGLIEKCARNCDLKSMEKTAAYWFGKHEELLRKYNGENYKLEYDIAVETFDIARKEIGLSGDSIQYADMLKMHWTRTDAFPEAGEFFAKCPVPVYLVTNNDTEYIVENMNYNGLKPAGIVSSQTAGYYKPRKEIFEKALELTGLKADEVIHVGDSIASDIKGAEGAGIKAVWIDRSGKIEKEMVRRIHSLTEILEWDTLK